MKVIQIATFFHPVTGGVETQVKELSQQLKAKGHTVEVFTTDSSRNRSKVSPLGEIVEGIDVKRFRTWFSISKFHKFAPGMFVKLLKSDFDIIHVHGIRKFEMYAALFAAKIKRKKVVLTTHNPFEVVGRNTVLNQLIKLHDLTLGKLFTRYFDKIICLLPYEETTVHTKFKVPRSKIAVIPNGINEKFFEKIEVDKASFLLELGVAQKFKHVVLAACRLNEIKGLQNLKYAVTNLPDTLFLFAGADDGYETELHRVFKEDSNVHFTGDYLTTNDLRKAYEVADIFVLPSLHEPFGLTPVEAVATGTPVIATNIGGTKHVLDQSYTVFLDPHDQKKWYMEIKQLLHNSTELKRKAALGKEDVDKYRWKNITTKIEQVYQSL